MFPVVGCTISEELFFEGKMVLSSVASGFIAMFSKFRFLSCNGFFLQVNFVAISRKFSQKGYKVNPG